MRWIWLQRTAVLVISLPLSLAFIGVIAQKPAAKSIKSAGIFGLWGAGLAVFVIAIVAIGSLREARREGTSDGGLEMRMKIWGFAALGVYVLTWLATAAWLVKT